MNGLLTYVVFMLPGLAFVVWAQFKVKGTYKRFKDVRNGHGITGAQAARRILDAAGLRDVPVEAIPGELTDHYDPRARALRLSEGVYGVPSVAAMAIAAHEAGHALQHDQAYAPMRLRTAIVPAVNIGSNLGFIVLFAGMLLNNVEWAWLGVILFSLATLFALVTLPVEFDASRRAKVTLVGLGLVDGGVTGGSEGQGVATMLNAAAWTYVAGFAASLLTLLYYVMTVAGMRSSEE